MPVVVDELLGGDAVRDVKLTGQCRPKAFHEGAELRSRVLTFISRSSRRNARTARARDSGPSNAASSKTPRARSSSRSGHSPSLRKSDSASSTHSTRSMATIVSNPGSQVKPEPYRALADNQGRAPWLPRAAVTRRQPPPSRRASPRGAGTSSEGRHRA